MHLMRRIELVVVVVVVVFEVVAIGMQSTATTTTTTTTTSTTTTSTTSSLEMQKTMKRRRSSSSKFNSSNSSNTTQIFARVLKEMEFGSGTKYPHAKKLRTQCRFRKIAIFEKKLVFAFPSFPSCWCSVSLSLSRSLSLYICGSQNAWVSLLLFMLI
jgi:hypothetical protein